MECSATRPKGTVIPLSSGVGATENVMMAAVMAEGERGYELAKEPEIIDLQNYLVSYGAHCERKR